MSDDEKVTIKEYIYRTKPCQLCEGDHFSERRVMKVAATGLQLGKALVLCPNDPRGVEV